MSRYTDADALHDALKAKQKWVVRRGDKHNEGYTYDQVHFAIDDAPSIDIVRCKERVHCADDWNGNQPMFTCDLGRCGESVQPNDFCSYGERSE